MMEKLYQGPPKNCWYVSYITIWNIYYKILFSFINPTKQGEDFFLLKIALNYNMQGINDFTFEGEGIRRVWARLVLLEHFS